MIRSLLIRAALLAGLCAASPVAAQDAPRLRTGGSATASVAEGLELDLFARRLGAVSDIALGADGTIFAADPDSGRIWVLRDRGMDGRADGVQPLPHRFDLPSGLAVSDTHLYVSDRSGLWRVAGSGTPDLLAPFARAGATDRPHPVALAPDGSLRLGLSRPDGTARLLRVDAVSGEAFLLGETAGQIKAFAKGPTGTPLLILVERKGETLIGASLDALQPADAHATAAWAEPERGIVILSGTGGVSERAVSLLGVGDDGVALIRGLDTGAVLRDRRGLFIAEPGAGTIRRLSPRLPQRPVVPERETPAPQPRLDPEQLLLRGSGIGRASTLPEADAPTPESRQPETDSE